MKVAVLTQPLHINFGGTLQAFALQKVLIDMGCEVETIDYRNKDSSNLRKLLSFFKHFLKNNNKNYPFFYKEKIIRQKKHRDFMKDNIKLSKEIYTSECLREYIDTHGFNNILVGSDQVWRKSYSPNINDYFYEFLFDNSDINKLSYAASFGLDFWEYDQKETEVLKKLISKFDGISVREKSAIRLCDKHLNATASLVLDPTLLLSKKEYIKLLNLEIGGERGIFKYILDESLSKNKVINSIKIELGKEVFTRQPKKIVREGLFISDIQDYIYPSIESWVEAFYAADFIVTDSFHGSVFSIIFNKPFIAIVNKERGASRFESLFELLGISERLIYDEKELNIDYLKQNMDYSVINSRLDGLREESLKWLKESLK